MSRALDDLDPRFKPKAMEFLARLVEQQILVLIVCTGRTAEEQARAVATGASQVTHSRHQDGMAMDICPYQQWLLHGNRKLNWDTSDPVWKVIGQVAESIGLRWGGRFTPLDANGMGWDAGHVEIPEKMTRSGEMV